MNKQRIDEQYQHISMIIDLSKRVVELSQLIPEDQKHVYLAEYDANAEEATAFRDKGSQSALKQLQKELLTPWDETADEDSRQFWRLAKEQHLPIGQTDYLAKILARGRIANHTEYDIVQDLMVVGQQEGQITQDQAEKLEAMLDMYERKHS